MQVLGIFCCKSLYVGRDVCLRGFSEEQQPMPREESNRTSGTPHRNPNVKYCLILAFKNMLETTPGKQIPPTCYGPNVYKADQYHVSTVALMFTTFINWTVSDSLFGSCFKKLT